MTAPAPAPSWKLVPEVAALTQGLVVTGFGSLPFGRALLLSFDWPDAPPAGWLQRLSAAAPVTSATPPDKGDPAAQLRATALAFTAHGLRRMGLAEPTLLSFSRAFREGMFQEDRLRRLGDRREGQWLDTVVPGGPQWGGNAPPREAARPVPSGYEVPHEDEDPAPVATPLSVHALLLLYTATEADAAAWAAQVAATLAADGVTVARDLDLVLDPDKQAGYVREHFGFADALSQPLPYDDQKAVLVGDQPAVQDAVQGVPLGEFLIGYVDGHHEPAPGPVIDDADRARQAQLPPAANAEGFFDLGKNGSYLVARELKQYVAAFWRSMADNAAAIRARDPAGTEHVTADWLAARIVGRDKDGHLLCPGGVMPACSDGSPDSSFAFFDRDQRGAGCPPGSHVRRTFPRDGLAPTAPDKPTLLRAANNHRILRRGRKFGPPAPDHAVDDGADRGLLFMCLNTDIDRQFEFVQQTWMLNSSFATLSDEVDPLVGPAGRMTIRDQTLRRTAMVDTFVRMAGGDYFFLPSLPALSYLAQL